MRRTHLPNVVAASFVILVSNVAGLDTENIIGGRTGVNKEVQYFVSIQIETQHYCGGTLIAPDIVLSAAHCFVEEGKHTYYNHPYLAVAGTLNSNNYTYRRHVKTIYIYSGFLKPKETVLSRHDIAILKLNEGFRVGKNLPIDLAMLPNKDENYVGMIVKASGFGQDNFTNDENGIKFSSSGILKIGYKEILEPKECKAEKYPEILCERMRSNHGIVRGTCRGDSGGPIVLDKKVIGIVSKGPYSCDESKIPATSTKVSAYLDFINSVLNNKLTSDMIVRHNVFAILDTPVKKWAVTTKPDTEIKMLEKIRELYLKSLNFQDELTILNQLYVESSEYFRRLGKIPKTLKKSRNAYYPAHNEFASINKEREINLKKLLSIQTSMDEEINAYNAFFNKQLRHDYARKPK